MPLFAVQQNCIIFLGVDLSILASFLKKKLTVILLKYEINLLYLEPFLAMWGLTPSWTFYFLLSSVFAMLEQANLETRFLWNIR